jgi:hypothetical protein
MGTRFFALVQTGLWVSPASFTMGIGSFPGLKRPGHGVDHPPLLGPRLKKEVNFTFTFTLLIKGYASLLFGMDGLGEEIGRDPNPGPYGF